MEVLNMNKESKELLDKKLKEIVEKHKNKPLLYKKLQRIATKFRNCRKEGQEIYKELAKLTAKVDFGCGFENGECKAKRSLGWSSTEMCCCKDCASNIGYLNIIFFSEYSDNYDIQQELLYYTKKYQFNTGFWRKGKGCILPREKRSTTCLTYKCSHTITNEEELLFTLIREEEKPYYIHTLISILKDYFLYREVKP